MNASMTGKSKRYTVWSSIAVALATLVVWSGLATGLIPQGEAVAAVSAWATVVFLWLLVWTQRTLFLSFAMLTAMITLFDSGMYVYEKITEGERERLRHRYVAEIEYRTQHPELESMLVPSVSTKESMVYPDGVHAYTDAPYTIDEHKRRVHETPGPAAERHALFMGGSYTFGLGLSADDALPWRFEAESARAYTAVNLAAPGHGPSQMLVRARSGDLFDHIDQHKGIAVYSFIDDHLNRTTPFEADAIIQYENYPHFLLEDGVLMGPLRYREVPPYRLRDDVYRGAKRYSPTARMFLPRMGITYQSRSDALRVVAEVISETRDHYHERFDGQFYVVVWPRMVQGGNAIDGFSDEMQARGIAVLHPSPMPESRGEARIHPRDPHPSAAENAWIAENLWAMVSAREADHD